MLLIRESHVFKLRVKRKFEMFCPWSNRNATSVFQRRKPQSRRSKVCPCVDKLKFANQMGQYCVEKIRNIHSKLDNFGFTLPIDPREWRRYATYCCSV